MSRVKIEEAKEYIFITEINVRITDINYGGHLAHDRVLAMTQEARAGFLHEHGFSELDVCGCGLIVYDAAISYKGESFYGETLKIEMAVVNARGKSCDFVYNISEKESGRKIARAKVGVAFFDYEARKSVPIPQEFLALLQEQ